MPSPQPLIYMTSKGVWQLLASPRSLIRSLPTGFGRNSGSDAPVAVLQAPGGRSDRKGRGRDDRFHGPQPRWVMVWFGPM